MTNIIAPLLSHWRSFFFIVVVVSNSNPFLMKKVLQLLTNRRSRLPLEVDDDGHFSCTQIKKWMLVKVCVGLASRYSFSSFCFIHEIWRADRSIKTGVFHSRSGREKTDARTPIERRKQNKNKIKEWTKEAGHCRRHERTKLKGVNRSTTKRDQQSRDRGLSLVSTYTAHNFRNCFCLARLKLSQCV